jgi:hypothetical protein
MEQQDELFQMIKALSKSEKKFFTQYVNIYEKGSSPIYLQLFDFLNIEPVYSEERIFKKFRDVNLFEKNFAVTKHYLKQMIIKTLRHSELTVRDDRDLTVYILDIKRLMAKGLFPMAKKMIEKLKTEAYEDEKLNDIIHLIAMQRGLIAMGYYRHEPDVNLDSLDVEEENLMETIRQLRNIMNCSIKLHARMNYEINVSPEENNAAIKELGKKISAFKYEELKSAKARHTYLQFWALYHCALGDYKKYGEWANKKLDFVKNEPHPKSVNNWLVLGYNHCLAASILTNDFTEFENRVKYLEAMEFQSQFHDANRFETVSMFALLYYIRQNNAKKIEHYIEYAKEGLDRLAPFISKAFSYTLRTSVAYAYLKLGKLDECVTEVNELMALTNGDTRRDYVGHIKVINLMLRFEMKEYHYLSYLLKNTYRFFMTYLHASPVHKFIISYMKDALKTTDQKGLQELNKQALEKLREIRIHPKEADITLVSLMEDYLSRK